MIDDFEAGDFSVSNTPLDLNSSEQEVSGIPTANTVGGVRLASVNSGSSTATAFFSLTTNPLTDDSAVGTTLETGLFNLYYDGIANGVRDGKSGALNLDLSSDDFLIIDAITGAGTTARVTIWTSSGSQRTDLEPLEVGAPTSIELAVFDSLDLSDVQSIRLQFDNLDGTAGNPSISVQSIYTAPVPEPGTALLLASGLTALGLRRSRRRNA